MYRFIEYFPNAHLLFLKVMVCMQLLTEGRWCWGGLEILVRFWFDFFFNALGWLRKTWQSFLFRICTLRIHTFLASPSNSFGISDVTLMSRWQRGITPKRGNYAESLNRAVGFCNVLKYSTYCCSCIPPTSISVIHTTIIEIGNGSFWSVRFQCDSGDVLETLFV